MNFKTHVERHGRSRLALLTTVIVLAIGLLAYRTQDTSAEPRKVNDADRRMIAGAVAQLMEISHLSRHKLDDEISQRCLEAYVESLDPRKLYFYDADVKEFMTYGKEIDDKLMKGDVQLAHEIFDHFLRRVDERLTMIDDILDHPIDFTADDELITDPDLLSYPKDQDEMRDRWTKRIKYDLLVRKTDEMTPEKALEKVRRRYHSAARRWRQTNTNELLERYLTAMTMGFDPHSSYMSPDTLFNFEISMRLELEGIGASLQQEDGYTVVKKVIPGGAADKHGKANPEERLKPEDQIVSVGQGTEGEMTDSVDMKLTDVVKLIRGKAGSVVRLGVIPGEGAEEIVYTITRERIELKDSEARSEIIEFGDNGNGQAFRIGVIDLPSFYMDMAAAKQGVRNYKSSVRDVRRLLDDFRAKNVDAVLIDLRRNGGGALTEAVGLTGLFIDSGPVVQVKWPDGRVQPHDDPEQGTAWDGPLVVLVSKFSASASEIFAGAIKDYHRGIIVGDKATHGKGTVQQVYDLGERIFRRGPDSPKYGALKMTIQQFYLPNGDSTQNRGVASDIELPSVTTHWPVGESDLDFAMAFDQVKPVPHFNYDMTNENLVQELRKRSSERIQQSEEFGKALSNISRYIERRERKTMPLNREEFLAERAEFDQDKEEREKLEELSDSSDAVVDRNYYFDEALAITQDYVDLLRQNQVAENRNSALATPAVP